jgi:hypothetical protein
MSLRCGTVFCNGLKLSSLDISQATAKVGCPASRFAVKGF